MMRYIAVSFLFLVLGSCQKQKKAKSQVGELPSTEVIKAVDTGSQLAFPIDFPAASIASLLNKVMPDVLVDDTLKLNDKGDYLKLLIEPKGRSYASAYSNNLDTSVPLKVSAYINKKVFGMNVGNKEPLIFLLRVDMNTQLAIDEDWYLNGICRIQKIRWIEKPELDLFGFKIDLEDLITRKLEENSDKIGDVVCSAIRKVVPIREQVEKVWQLMNTTHKLVQTPVPIFLSAAPFSFNAYFAKDVTDTVRLLMDVRSNIFITPFKGLDTENPRLPKNKGSVTKGEKALDLNVVLKLPFREVNKVLNELIGSKELEYEGVNVRMVDFKASSEERRLRLDLKVKGDVTSKLAIMASPSLSESNELLLENIDYQVSENRWLEALNELGKEEVMDFLKS
ncbi:MAG: DUF4403 family protein, partial [Bacteroidota bacterium]